MQVDLELQIPPLQPSECWDYKYVYYAQQASFF
jgi:hypothetical protein